MSGADCGPITALTDNFFNNSTTQIPKWLVFMLTEYHNRGDRLAVVYHSQVPLSAISELKKMKFLVETTPTSVHSRTQYISSDTRFFLKWDVADSA